MVSLFLGFLTQPKSLTKAGPLPKSGPAASGPKTTPFFHHRPKAPLHKAFSYTSKNRPDSSDPESIVTVNSKTELDLSILDKLFTNLGEAGKSARRLLVSFLALLVLVSALYFEPGIFGVNTQVTRDAAPSTEQIPFFGLKVPRELVLKYSSLLLSALYAMVGTYLIHLGRLRGELLQAQTQDAVRFVRPPRSLPATEGQSRKSLALP